MLVLLPFSFCGGTDFATSCMSIPKRSPESALLVQDFLDLMSRSTEQGLLYVQIMSLPDLELWLPWLYCGM